MMSVEAGLLTRLQALRGHDGDGPIAFTVDGVSAAAEAFGRRIRLSCEVLPAVPDDEAEARALMAQYLPYADHGAEVLCADADRRLLLVAVVDPNDDLAITLRDFCDAAVFWSGAASARADVASLPTAIIFP